MRLRLIIFSLAVFFIIFLFLFLSFFSLPDPAPSAKPKPIISLVSPEIIKKKYTEEPKIKSAYSLWRDVELVKKPLTQRFYKIDMNGQILNDDASYWACVYDDFTGLIWEVKQNDGGWQDNQHTFSWYEPPAEISTDISNNDLVVITRNKPEYGVQDNGSCYEISCDTHSYQQAVNEQWLCSLTDWRLPESHELGVLDHPTNYYPDIDTHYFPNTKGSYWARTEVPSMKTLAWSVDFGNGFPYIVEKRMGFHVRLVTEFPWLSQELKKKGEILQ